jgi:hypothetical protein
VVEKEGGLLIGKIREDLSEEVTFKPRIEM